MKTSNKILLGLLAVIFTVPFLFASSLKSKMEKDEYTVVKDENLTNGMLRSGSFSSFKVVKVVAPGPDYLICHLKPSDDMSYRYFNDDSKDSVMIFTSNDTLYIRYASKELITRSDERRDHNRFEVNVNLPAFSNLVVDGAVVIIDSLPASPANLSVTLRNNGEIKDGSENRDEAGVKVSPADINKAKALEAPETREVATTSDPDMKSVKTVKNGKLELMNLDMKDLIFYSLVMMN